MIRSDAKQNVLGEEFGDNGGEVCVAVNMGQNFGSLNVFGNSAANGRPAGGSKGKKKRKKVRSKHKNLRSISTYDQCTLITRTS